MMTRRALIAGAALLPTPALAQRMRMHGHPIRNIAFWGDSLTQNIEYPNRVSGNLSRTIFNGGVGGQGSTQIKDRMVAAVDKHLWVTSIWSGRNDLPDATTQSNIDAMVAALTTAGNSRFVILSIINGSNANEYAGQSWYIAMASVNAYLASTYPNNYLDVRAYLISQYLVGDATDELDALTRDTVPTSLRDDPTHLSQSTLYGGNPAQEPAGYEIVATLVSNFIAGKGW